MSGGAAMSGGAQVPHVPPQQRVAPAHTTPPQVHLPPVHCSPSSQCTPHAPQSLMLDCTSLQPFTLQHAQPVWHIVAPAEPAGQPHDPPRHTCPSGHCTPQSPQFERSAITSMHVVPQHLPPHCSGCAGQI